MKGVVNSMAVLTFRRGKKLRGRRRLFITWWEKASGTVTKQENVQAKSFVNESCHMALRRKQAAVPGRATVTSACCTPNGRGYCTCQTNTKGIDNSIGSRTKTSLQKMMRCLTTSIVHHAAAARSESTCCHATITFQIKQRQNKYQWFDRDASYLPGRQVAIHLNLMGETGPAYLGAEDEVGLTLGSPPFLLM
jgi:hypothetical protein